MFIPHTDSEREEMLKEIGIGSLDELFSAVPKDFRFPKLNLPPALSEMEVLAEMTELASVNESTRELLCFLGAGAYDHYIPAAVDAIIRRGEFLTAYTPYQPEISQGTLQAIFEYQSLIALLTGMEVSNASHYDGATAAAEAAVLAYHHFRGKRSRIVLSPAVNPQYRAVLRTYMSGYAGLEIVGDEAGGSPFTSVEELTKLVDLNTSMVVVQYPDFFGRIEDLTAFAQKVHEAGALLTVVVNPTALALLKTPGEFGADMVVGEGQPLGIPMSFGGPYLGLFATKKELVRKIAGRLVGETQDAKGQRGYVLTLTAREQHIRREKATSNICTNSGLCSLAFTIHMSLLGEAGLRRLAAINHERACRLADALSALPGVTVINDTFFNEFTVRLPRAAATVVEQLAARGILAGVPVSRLLPGEAFADLLLVAATETASDEDQDAFVAALREVL